MTLDSDPDQHRMSLFIHVSILFVMSLYASPADRA